MARQADKTCSGTRADGAKCNSYVKEGEEYCHWHKTKQAMAEVVTLAERRDAVLDSGDESEIDAFLWRVLRGEERETRATARGDVYESEAQVRDKLAAARELRARRGLGTGDGDEVLDTIADRIRDRLGLG